MFAVVSFGRENIRRPIEAIETTVCVLSKERGFWIIEFDDGSRVLAKFWDPIFKKG